jgi:hypothetical protein
MRRPDERDVRTALRDEADRHRPDRAAMLNRIAQGRSAPPRRPVDRLLALLRPVAAAVAVAVVLVLAVAGVRLSTREPDRNDDQVAAPTRTPVPATTATAAPEPSVTPSRPPRTTSPRTTDPATPTTPTTPASPPDRGRDGFLDSAGELDPHSNDGWSQQHVELKTTKKLTAVDVTITVALTPGVVETGRFTTVPTHMVTMTSSRVGRTLVYRFTLLPGNSLAPGRYTFAAQFNHAAGERPRKADSYRAEATGGAEDVSVTGGFTAP